MKECLDNLSKQAPPEMQFSKVAHNSTKQYLAGVEPLRGGSTEQVPKCVSQLQVEYVYQRFLGEISILRSRLEVVNYIETWQTVCGTPSLRRK